MERIPDWALLWRQLVAVTGGFPAKSRHGEGQGDPWQKRAKGFDELSKGRASLADPIRDFLASRVDADTTVLDIGAGTGRLTVLLAPRSRLVTALEPSPAMLEILRRNVEAERLANVAIVEGRWPEAEVEPHDVTLCSHAMYGSPDLPGFVRRMVDVTRRTCFLVLRMPVADGVMAEAAQRVFGHPYDSPNFVVAYNVLLQMGLCPNVLVDPALWDPWTSASLAEALAEVKRRLGLGDQPSAHDEYLLDLLSRRLLFEDGKYVWPPGVFSVLVYWNVG